MLHLDTGNTGFMILCASLVMLMTPGLAFFYGGLVGRKNVLAIMMQSFVSMGWTTVIWYPTATRCASAATGMASSATAISVPAQRQVQSPIAGKPTFRLSSLSPIR